MELYEKTDEHKKNNDAFRKIVRRYNWAGFYQPSPEKAPWHWKCRVEGMGPYITEINFWPHVAKAQSENGSVVVGWENIRSLISGIIDQDGYDTFEVFE